MNTNVIALVPDQIDEAASILTEASLMDPLMGFLFGSDLDIRRRSVRATMATLCRLHVAMDEPVLAVEQNGQLAAVALLGQPGRPSWPALLREEWGAMERTIGGAAAERMERYGELHARHGMDAQHIYLIDVGVYPQFKGQGHGSRLMGHVIGLSEAHPDSIGVALDTANPANLAYYQGFGFGVKASDWLKSAQLCFMFRANGAGQ